jgi:hypothetical protein
MRDISKAFAVYALEYSFLNFLKKNQAKQQRSS